MFVSSEGLKERWRVTSSHDEIDMSLSDRVREQIYGGHKLHQYLTESEHGLPSGSKNDLRCSDTPNSFRQSSFSGHSILQSSARDRSASSIDSHYGDHPVQLQSNDGVRFSGKRAIVATSSTSIGSSNWPPLTIVSLSENAHSPPSQQQHQSCNYPSNENQFESPGVAGIATRYDVGTTNYLADRFLSSSYSSISPSSVEHLHAGGLGHHGFSTPPAGVSQFYVEPPLSVLASGLDVGVPRAVGCLSSGSGFPSMTVNLSMSMNVVENPTSARRGPQSAAPPAWNVADDDEDDEDDDDVNDSVPDMRWPGSSNYATHHQFRENHHLHHNNNNNNNNSNTNNNYLQQQQHHTGYRCGGLRSPQTGGSGWRLLATPANVSCFKRSPGSSAADCGGQVVPHLTNAGPDNGLVYLSSRRDLNHEQQHFLATQPQHQQQQQNLQHQHHNQHHHQSRFQASGLQSFYNDADGGTATRQFSSGSQFQNRRDSGERGTIIAGRQMAARCHQRLFSTGAQPQTTSSTTHMNSSHHHHHHHQRQAVFRSGNGASGNGLIRASQRHQHDVRCTMSRDSGATEINGDSSMPVDSLTGRPNVCRICDKTYARPSTLKTHLRTHSGEKPYTCGTCRKAFSQAANLTAHLRTHTGERPFSCPVCSRRFSQSSSVATHLRTHSGERPYRCRLCSKTFSDSSTLTKHLRIHSGEKPYQCSICLLRFSQSGNLNRHKRVHGPA